jgi:hypothetical protein
MKMMSTRADFDDVENVKRSLVEAGAIIFKVVDCDEIIPGLGLQASHSQIIFCIMEETATVFKLKYPPGTFEEH